jgi:hypothetical protein
VGRRPGKSRSRTEQETREEAGDCTQRSGEGSARRAGASSTCVAPASQTPFESSRSRGDLDAPLGSGPARSRGGAAGVFGLNAPRFRLNSPSRARMLPPHQKANSYQ